MTDKTLTEEQIECMKEDLCVELVRMLMHQQHCSMEEAMSVLYNSKTFARLNDTATGLYYQSSGYVFSYLSQEQGQPAP